MINMDKKKVIIALIILTLILIIIPYINNTLGKVIDEPNCEIESGKTTIEEYSRKIIIRFTHGPNAKFYTAEVSKWNSKNQEKIVLCKNEKIGATIGTFTQEYVCEFNKEDNPKIENGKYKAIIVLYDESGAKLTQCEKQEILTINYKNEAPEKTSFNENQEKSPEQTKSEIPEKTTQYATPSTPEPRKNFFQRIWSWMKGEEF